MNCILALDLASKTGWAMAALTPQGKIQIQSGVQEFTIAGRTEGAGMRYLRFRSWLYDMHKLCPIERLSFEEIKQRQQSVAAANMYGGMRAVLVSWCEENGIPYEGVMVGEIKKHATGKGNAGKDEMVKAMRAKGHNPKDDNEADALAQLYWVLTYATPSATHIRPAPDGSSEGLVPVGTVPVARRRIRT